MPGVLRTAQAMSEDSWERAGFLDRVFGDLCDGIIAVLVAAPPYWLIDKWLLESTGTFLDESEALGAVDVVVWPGSSGTSRTWLARRANRGAGGWRD